MKRAIVLSGGGSKGSYELGVWKAIRRLHISYDIITGTSIGALNGALMTQKTYLKACHIWHKLNLEYLFEESAKSDKKTDVLKLFGENFLKHGGMNISKIENIIKDAIHIHKFYSSNINYGLITYNFTTKKPLSLQKKDIKKEKLVDYLMASATCFPAFQMKDIDGEKFIDGGFYDNLPINLALDMGADELIVVDLKAPGLKQKPKNEKNITYIAPRNNISFFLNFNPKQAKENMKFGYNDTMKVFGKLDGNLFTFRKNSIAKYYKKKRKKLDSIVQEKDFLNLLESLGRSFSLREDKIYRVSTFLRKLKKEVKKESTANLSFPKEIVKANTKVITLYFLNRMEKGKKVPKAILLLLPKHEVQAKFLMTIGAYYGK